MPHSSCILYHGPGAGLVAHGAAKAHGRLVLFEGQSLKKDGARELVELMASLPVGSGSHSVLVGPLDEVAPGTSDVLLKTLEEFDPRGIRPFLWAWDLGGVSPTIRSRCVCQYSPGVDERLEAYASQGSGIVKAYKAKDWVGLIELLKDSKGDEPQLLGSVIEILSLEFQKDSPDPRLLSLWSHLRPLFNGSVLTPARVVSAFLEAGI